jgi:selenocysteine lyase/cysteine desulfurase
VQIYTTNRNIGSFDHFACFLGREKFILSFILAIQNAAVMSSRRQFLKKTGISAGMAAIAPALYSFSGEVWSSISAAREAHADDELLHDERFWAQIRGAFTTSANLINLNNGGVSPQPRSVQEAHIRYYGLSNEAPSYYMWRTLDQGRESLRLRLAGMAGCLPDEIAINRNTTEGLNSVIFGLNLKAGDEVVLSTYDYPNMMNAWKQREKRDGIRLNWVNLSLPMEDEAEIVSRYSQAISAQTRVVHITHVINWNGQLMPVRKIAEVAREKGCLVIVDGAHSFAHIQHRIPETGADFYATSLHKWLCAPFGSGLLYIRKNLISGIWPLLSSENPESGDIRKFESLGTRSFASEMAIAQAIDFHEMIGSSLKERRLKFLKEYWMQRVKSLPGVTEVSSSLEAFATGIGHVQVRNWSGAQLEKYLLDTKRIHAIAIQYENLDGLRVSPHVYTSLRDLDQLIQAFAELVNLAAPSR